MSDFKKVLKKVFKMAAKEFASETEKIQQH